MEGEASAFTAWVLELDMLEFVFLLGFSGIFMLIMFFVAYRKLRAYRIVVDTPTARIRSAPQGYTEIQGVFAPLDADHPRRAPFSGKACAWYRAWMEEQRGSGKNKRWVTIFEEVDPRPCRLCDDTGECLVLPGEANMRLATESESWRPDSWFGDAPEPLQAVETGLFSRKVRFKEERIETGRGYAIGRFTTSDGSEDGESVDAMVKLCDAWRTDYMAEIEGRPDKQRPNPKPEDWDPHKAPHAIARWIREQGYADGPVHVLSVTDESRRPFIVGVGDEEAIARSLRRQWIGCSIGFIVFGGFFLAVLGARAGLIA